MSDVLLIPVLIWILTQLIKGFRLAYRGKRFDLRHFFQSGGMPSSHTATVISLALMVGLRQGFSSALFSVTAVFAGVVAYDSLGVRRSAGEQARMINRILAKVFPSRSHGEADLKVVLGHHPDEVLGGVIFGLVVTYVLQLFV